MVTHHRLRSVAVEDQKPNGALVEVDPDSELTDPYVVGDQKAERC